ncbi:hypothetical protein [uncultured Mediterranean phage]|nr:hypothetical protein [uncultured Mediterranean phage]
MNTDTYKVIKLLNGEEIICQLSDDIVDDSYEVTHPLKMQVQSQITNNGVVESLNLSRWIGPYTEQSFFNIKTSHVLTIADASEGLCRYYDHVIREINKSGSSRTTELLDDINDEDVYEDLLKEAETDKTIH